LNSGKKDLLTIYFTAGFPDLKDTRSILAELEKSGADMVEIGIPYSDPVADGGTIQQSNQQALENGMSIPKLFEQLEEVRKEISIPIILMGYFNPIMQYGVEQFCIKCQEIGVDGLIIPDLPIEVYKKEYEEFFEVNGLINIFMITPQTSDQRIHMIDRTQNGFIYMVSSASITGENRDISTTQKEYFERIKSMRLDHPLLIGFGISTHEHYKMASSYARGAIIGSAFIKSLQSGDNPILSTQKFIESIKKEQ